MYQTPGDNENDKNILKKMNSYGKFFVNDSSES
jgi:hypothetical protein